MNNRIRIAISTMALILVIGLGLAGARMAALERERAEHSERDLQQSRLAAVDQIVTQFFDAAAGRIEPRMNESPASETERLREFVRGDPLIRGIVIIDSKNGVVHPPLESTQMERESLLRILTSLENPGTLSPSASEGGGPSKLATGAPPRGWHSWPSGEGMRFVFWSNASGERRVAEIGGASLLAQLIGALPDGAGFASGNYVESAMTGAIRILDHTGRIFYQWGEYEAPDGQSPFAERLMNAPLQFWKLQYLAPPGAGASVYGAQFQILAAFVAAAFAIIAFAIFAGREMSRRLREAGQRVNFVNQVSHELKTPLTNIQLYAELMEDNLGEGAPDQAKRLNVIVQESQRLGRLIANVLAFGKEQKGTLTIRRQTGVLDEAVRETLDRFEPSLRSKGIAAETALQAQSPFPFDRDAIAQIAGNLIENVEKYAAEGGRIRVETAQQNGYATLRVIDGGPGIPPRERERIFAPFYRLDNRLSASAAGSGIGLSIARQLARLHGGDLLLVESEQGTCFELRLPVSIHESENAPS